MECTHMEMRAEGGQNIHGRKKVLIEIPKVIEELGSKSRQWLKHLVHERFLKLDFDHIENRDKNNY